MDRPFDLGSTFVRLGQEGTAELVALTPEFWGASCSSGPADRFVGIVAFGSSDDLHADSLERHPAADELLLVLEGAIALVIETPDHPRRVELAEGEACRVPRGLWHRLEVIRPGRLLFVNSRYRMESRPLRKKGGGHPDDDEEHA